MSKKETINTGGEFHLSWYCNIFTGGPSTFVLAGGQGVIVSVVETAVQRPDFIREYAGLNLGVYANYTATRTDGVEIGGRIQYVCIDRTLYGLEILFPAGFREDFIDVFGEIRGSMKTMY